MNLTPLDERRLAELKQFVAARAVAGVLQPARRPARRMLRPAIGVGAAAGAAAIALAVTSGGLPGMGGSWRYWQAVAWPVIRKVEEP